MSWARWKRKWIPDQVRNDITHLSSSDGNFIILI